MDSAIILSIIGIGALILLLLWYRSYVKENIGSLKIKQKKIVEIDLLGKKTEIVPIDIYSAKSALKPLFIALVMIILLTLYSFLLIHFSIVD